MVSDVTRRTLLSARPVMMFGRFLLVLTGIFLGLGVAEVGLRMVGYEGMQERVNTVYHDDLGQVPEDAWVNDAVFDPRRSSDMKINGQSVPFEKEAGRLRIVFIGDSGTYGAGVDRDEAFPVVFRDLEEKVGDRDLEVVNAGVVGLTNVGEYRLLADRLVKLEPDVVVLGLFMANDINWNLGNQYLLGEPPSAWTTLGLRLREHSALAHFAYLQLLALDARYRILGEPDTDSPEEVSPINLTDENGIHMLDYLGGEIATYEKQYSPLMEYAFDLLRDVLSRCKTLGEKHGFQFVVVIIPTSSQIAGELDMFIWPDALTELGERDVRIAESELDFEKPLRFVRDICTELEIVCIDPTDAMRRIGATRAILPGDDHPTPEGHRILGASLVGHFDDSRGRFADCSRCPTG